MMLALVRFRRLSLTPPLSDGGAACILVLVDRCPAYLTMVARGFFLSFQVSHGRRKRA